MSPLPEDAKGLWNSISFLLRGAAGYLLTSWRLCILTEASQAAFLTADGMVKSYTRNLCVLLGTVSFCDPLGELTDLPRVS